MQNKKVRALYASLGLLPTLLLSACSADTDRQSELLTESEAIECIETEPDTQEMTEKIYTAAPGLDTREHEAVLAYFRDIFGDDYTFARFLTEQEIRQAAGLMETPCVQDSETIMPETENPQSASRRNVSLEELLTESESLAETTSVTEFETLSETEESTHIVPASENMSETENSYAVLESEDISETDSSHTILKSEYMTETEGSLAILESEDITETEGSLAVLESEDITETEGSPAVLESEDIAETESSPAVLESEGIAETESSPAVLESEDISETAYQESAPASENQSETEHMGSVLESEDQSETEHVGSVLESEDQSETERMESVLESEDQTETEHTESVLESENMTETPKVSTCPVDVQPGPLRDLKDMYRVTSIRYPKLKQTLSLLERRLSNMVSQYEGIWSVGVMDLRNNESIIINDRSMKSASIMKLFVMSAVYEAMEKGKLERTSEVVNRITAMIRDSSNEDSNKLLLLLGKGSMRNGIAKVNEYIVSHGYSDKSRLYNGFNNPDYVIHKNQFNSISAQDCMTLLSQIYHRTFGSWKVCNEIETLLLDQQTRYKIPKGIASVAPDVKVANKTGEMDHVENDVAFVYSPGCDFILCVFSDEWTNKDTAQKNIQLIAAETYQYFNSSDWLQKFNS